MRYVDDKALARVRNSEHLIRTSNQRVRSADLLIRELRRVLIGYGSQRVKIEG
jgi:hypothetical protein